VDTELLWARSLSRRRNRHRIPNRDDRCHAFRRPDQTAVASDISNTFRQVGAVFGVAIATAIIAAEGSYRTTSEFVNGLSPAFITLGLLCATGVLAGVLLRPAPSVRLPGQRLERLPLHEHQLSDHTRVLPEPDRQSWQPSTSDRHWRCPDATTHTVGVVACLNVTDTETIGTPLKPHTWPTLSGSTIAS
jgi:hypothetical protein